MKPIVAILLLCAAAVTSERCRCLPKQYSGESRTLILDVSNEKSQIIRATNVYAIDFDKGRQAGKQVITVSGRRFVRRYVVDLIAKVGYFIVMGKCTQLRILEETDRCLPGFQYTGSYSFMKNGSFVYDAFTLQKPPSTKFNKTFEMHWNLERESCIPIQSIWTSSASFGGITSKIMGVSNEVNTSLGVPNPGVFRIPSKCKRSKRKLEENWFHEAI